LEITGSISQTARDFGVTRATLYKWQDQLEKDLVLLKQVEAARNNIANLEELKAIKAQGELSRRLDNCPEDLKTQDLQKIIDSGINNSRLIRGQATAINESRTESPADALKHALQGALAMGASEDSLRMAAAHLAVKGIDEEGRARVLAEVLEESKERA
jgi:transposase-like protein